MNMLSKTLKVALALAVAAAVLSIGTAARAGDLAAKPRDVVITVTEKGFEPSPIKVKKGEPLRLLVTRQVEKTCATELRIKGTDIKAALPLGKQVEVLYTPQETGTVKYGCSMGMMIGGQLLVE